MDSLQQLIRKFWTGTATREEREQLLQRLDAGEDMLKEKMQVLFEEDIAPKKKPVRRLPSIAAWVAAAVIITALALPALYRPIAHQKKNLTAETQTLPRIDTIVNHGSKALDLTTSDGSQVLLYPGSSIRFRHSFDTNKREIRLDGKARFNVARDIHRPFLVLTHDLTTTVLGTTFLVNSIPSGDSWVQLFEGSVKVLYKPQQGNTQEVLLQPGEEVLAHSASNSLVISRMPRLSPQSPAFAASASSEKRTKPGESFAFHQEPLSTVFQQLGKRYHTRIIYDPDLVRGLVFTGSFTADRDLTSIVRIIATLNNLEVKPQGDSLILSR
ncbi:MAG TPA: FecR domain-containing protein [Puia sp.]|uniref:FecR family protein n=1 Tax=Puia sp. TaxID=2045100 RepID=UPI002BCE25E4|nr:FecR domain-containing protein [Puia sp.]HVU94196.1 FecR domain-containing protein [Puia sp.]